MAGTNLIAPLIIVFFAVFLHHKTNEIIILEFDQACLFMGTEFSYPSSLIRVNDEAVFHHSRRPGNSSMASRQNFMFSMLLLCQDQHQQSLKHRDGSFRVEFVRSPSS